MRLALPTVVCCAVLIAGCGSSSPKSVAPAKGAADRAFAKAPPPLASLYRERNRLIDGGAPAFKQRLASLRGHPVVVNKWASWCGPCRAEFPFFQREALKHAGSVAFIGVNSSDNDGNARTFLNQFPVPYPSYKDGDMKVAEVFNGVAAFPTTVYYGSSGKLVATHIGGYLKEHVLASDIARYAK